MIKFEEEEENYFEYDPDFDPDLNPEPINEGD